MFFILYYPNFTRIMTQIWCLLLFSVGFARGFNTELELDKYHSYEDITQFLKHFTRTFANLTRLYTIGKSVEGRELWVLQISGGKDKFLRPNVKLIGNIHGNEPVGRELLLHFAKFLVEKYNEGNERVRNLLDFAQVHILPSMNPDGFWIAMKHGMPGGPQSCSSGPGRNNIRDFNLNRNFPDHFRANSQQIQVETWAVMRWLEDVPFVLSASLHGGSLVVSYPFDNKEQSNSGDQEPNLTKDDDVFKHLANVYAQKHPDMHKGEPCAGSSVKFPNGITNGAKWYPLTGGMQDFNYVVHGCMELTLEISCCKFPKASDLPRYWNENSKPLLAFLEEVRRGIRGVVVDENGVGVPNASLYIWGRDPFYTTSKGEFWRILLPHIYYIEVAAAGFEKINVAIKVEPPNPNKWSQFVNITLHRVGSQPRLKNPVTWTNASLYENENQEKSSYVNYTDTHSVSLNRSRYPLERPLEGANRTGASAKVTHTFWMLISIFIIVLCGC